ncbi:hypothetical protein OAB57_01780 [Bacteriovoracaceae bacterium]|nr:hypothetical protein [Bacteriovoracaceae bacterium]
MNKKFGIEGIAYYLPRHKVDLEKWCQWTGSDWLKVNSVIGNAFRVLGPKESIYTISANALLSLIENYDIDPNNIGFLALGTESSTEKAAGAIIVKGMVSDELERRGKPRISRNCEVPEYKHACLGGIYAMKGAVRYLVSESQLHGGISPIKEKVAIVISADVAEYKIGSTGEQTQGCGAVAILVSSDPKLGVIDLSSAGTASEYRKFDFRKPLSRNLSNDDRNILHDFPVFNGKYSTFCYIEEVREALFDAVGKREIDFKNYFDKFHSILMHRPYKRMPRLALGLIYVEGILRNEELKSQAQIEFVLTDEEIQSTLQEIDTRGSVFSKVTKHNINDELYPCLNRMYHKIKNFLPLKNLLRQKMLLGEKYVSEMGNLYSASLPAWMGAAFYEASRSNNTELTDEKLLLVGYGSGDASESFEIIISPEWKEAASKINIDHVLGNYYNLSKEQYHKLHDDRVCPGDVSAYENECFVVDEIGTDDDSEFQDIGIEYYSYKKAV